ncbi:DUF3071 domain-containing protein [Phycicoccus sp. BSK3Z-2]|uniref:DUF3071 domain-containing protein n=1 Tax=Phycicoccus avicenniae TaxID=2828860 RepID=A0A941D9R8_9MICO|nr:septation protein SepH [Phycicoccus avicenniae]MBR7743445.1 DUF3071 domain-containing protein [Phycicoccus avicenniae]
MQDLRLIGVHEDGRHLLLADAEGGRFRLPLDEPLRAAARRDRPRLGQLQIEIDGAMRPREVQALIRRGMSAEEVADRAGWTVEKVRRFEGPILAEREHVARKARACAVGTRGSGPLTLETRATERLRDRGVEADAIEWDSSRDADGVWQLTLVFAAGGRQRTAAWTYEPLGGSVSATNDEARWLGDESSPGLLEAPHRAPSPEDHDVYDVDADGGIERPAARGATEPIDLMAAMRQQSARGRRSRRRVSPTGVPGDDSPREDALPIEELALDPTTVPPPPASRTWPQEQRSDDDSGTATPDEGSDDGPAEGTRRRSGAARKGRPSVPSWDDIVFGTKGGGSA